MAMSKANSGSSEIRKMVITVKIGSNVLTNEKGLPDESVIVNLCGQIKALRDQGHRVIVVTSGAVAAGRSLYQFPRKADTVVQRQVLSAIGQVKLIATYQQIFEKLGILCAQVPVTKDDFKSRHHYLNMKNCLTALLNNNIVPVINENDVISVTELMFTDNDELAGLVSAMLDTDMLVILTSVDGVYDGDPAKQGTSIIHLFDAATVNMNTLAISGASGFGRGGIITKCQTAVKIAGMGIPVHIANGRSPDIISRVLSSEPVGTRFPARKITSSFKKYMAHTYEEPKGKVVINAGARDSLISARAKSLLPVGVTGILGKFKKGDIIRIVDEAEKEIGLGLARYGHKKAKEVMGLKNQKPIIHYDHLYLH
jgi:glutamate 5-kinase